MGQGTIRYYIDRFNHRLRPGFWLEKLGITGTLAGPTESAIRWAIEKGYTGPEQFDEGFGFLTCGIATWTAGKFLKENTENCMQRSPTVYVGRGLQVLGAAATTGELLKGNPEPKTTFAPALAIPAGLVLEYVAGPIHEYFSSIYGNFPKDLTRKKVTRRYR